MTTRESQQTLQEAALFPLSPWERVRVRVFRATNRRPAPFMVSRAGVLQRPVSNHTPRRHLSVLPLGRRLRPARFPRNHFPHTKPPPSPLARRARLLPLSKGRGRFGRLRPKSVRGPPRNPHRPPTPFVVSRAGVLRRPVSNHTHQQPCPSRRPIPPTYGRRPRPARLPLVISRTSNPVRIHPPRGRTDLPLSKGRGRTCPGLDPGFRRLRRKSVRSLPSNKPPLKSPPLAPSPLRERVGVRVALTPSNQAPEHQAKPSPTSSEKPSQ